MKKLVALVVVCSFVTISWACTSFIISGQATPSGKPMMFKHRDTGELNNRIAYFQGEKYAFIGLVNSPVLDGEVWAGMNEAGFCIMNTASYNFREDSLRCKMDREGELMYHALGHCATLHDFEEWLKDYPQPWGVEANFGIIDAQGGAAYYEMNNHRWIKYDVNNEANGYRVVTNFSFAGREAESQGLERYLTAQAIMQQNFSRDKEMTAVEAIDLFSRTYRHELLGVNYAADNAPQYAVDQDFIPRRSTSAVVCFVGQPFHHTTPHSTTLPNTPPHTVMWTALGYPACAVAIPLIMNEKALPTYMMARNKNAKTGISLHSEMCDIALQIKNQWAFPLHLSNGKRYVATQTILSGIDGKPSLLSCTKNVETKIQNDFLPLYQQWEDGALTNQVFFKWYEQMSKQWFKHYNIVFAPYL